MKPPPPMRATARVTPTMRVAQPATATVATPVTVAQPTMMTVTVTVGTPPPMMVRVRRRDPAPWKSPARRESRGRRRLWETQIR